MRSSNPVLRRLGAPPHPPAAYGAPPTQAYSYGSHTYAVPTDPRAAWAPPAAPDVMTIDDVVVKTVSLLGTAVIAAAATWIAVPDTAMMPIWIAAMLIGLVLGLVISFAQITNPVVLIAYAAVEGVFLGAVSKAFETRWDGIVLQAVIATLGVFFTMAALYKTRIIRATPKFTRIVIGAAAGLAVVTIVNLLITMFTGTAGPLRDGGGLAIIFSLVCIVVAALMFVVTFGQIEDGVRAGLPRRYGWLGAFGILVELVWLYLEVLRLISFLQDD
jgi:uncharacterized YccA/Bax inhibitor family protein